MTTAPSRPFPRLVRGGLLLACAALALFPDARPGRDSGAGVGPDGDAAEAGPYPSDWFGIQRAFPGETIDQEAYLAALERARVDRAAAEQAIGSAIQSTGATWVEAGPYNIGGRATALAVVPGGTTVYLGAAAGGVWKSTNAGVNWTPVFDLVTSIGALALDPANPNVIYVGTGEANAAIDNYDGAGLFRSADGGQTWSYLGLQETRRIARVAVDPLNSSRIFVATMGAQFSTGPHRGLYRSEDGGLNWSKVLFLNDSTGVADVVIHPTSPETVYAATWERIRRPTYRRTFGPGCGIWRSTDSGATWTRLQSGLPAPSDDVGRIGLAIARSQPWIVYAQIIGGPALGQNGLGVYRTSNGGATWTRRDVSGFTSGFGGFGWYFGDFGVDPTDPNKVYALGVTFMASGDGGVTFSNLTGSAHVDQHAIWIDPTNPDRIYLGNDGGFYWSTSGGASWSKSLDLPITQFYAGTIDPSNPARLLGGTQDNNTLIVDRPLTAPLEWQAILGGDGFYCVVDPSDPNIILAEWQNCCGRTGPRRSVNGGASWSTPMGFNSNDRYNWNTPFVMDPNDRNVILVGSHRVYRSTNNGVSYSTISPDLTRNIPASLAYSTITTLDIAPSNSSYYYAGTDDGRVWRSTNAGGNWTEITAGLPLRWVTRVTADPTNADIVYVTLSGFSQDESAAHVFRSTNAGATWASISGNLPNVPANDLLVDPLDTSRLYLATDVGVYVTSNLGANWVVLATGLPLVPVFDLTLHNASRTLAAATHGRSQWKLDLSQVVAVAQQPRPARLALSSPIPNPGRGASRFVLEISDPGRVRVTAYDALGRRVRQILNQALPAGPHSVAWDGRDERGRLVSSGVYYVRAELEDRAVGTRRLVRLD